MIAGLDSERRARLAEAIRAASLDAIIVGLQKNVLMATGYYPVVGTSIAFVTKEGEALLVAPEDEVQFYDGCGADRIFPFSSNLEKPTTLSGDIAPALRLAVDESGLSGGAIGLEFGPGSQEASYIAANWFGVTIQTLIGELLPNAELLFADDLLDRQRSTLTTMEQQQLRVAVAVPERAYLEGASHLAVGMTEIEAAQYFQVPLSTHSIAADTVRRADGKVSCMSGTNSGSAYGAFAMSSRKVIAESELILTHCNSHADGYWTDITRTYYIGEPSERILRMYDAMLEASRAGIAAVKPGVRAADVDRVVRDVLKAHGFGDQFKHGTGHGVGFSATDHRATPRLQPNSPDIIEAGMVFNIEPGIYFEDFGGMRHCDMVLVTHSGAEILTPFHSSQADLLK